MQCVGCVTYCTTLMMSLSSKGICLLLSWMTRNGTTICEGSDEAVVNFLCLANCCYLIGHKMHGCLRHYSPESRDHPLNGSQNRTCYYKHGLVVTVLYSIRNRIEYEESEEEFYAAKWSETITLSS